MAEMPAFPVIVTHLEDAPGSGLAACSGRPFRTPGGFSNFARWLCTGCVPYARQPPVEGDAGACPTCHSIRCVGRLQYENCDMAEAQPYVGPDVNILGIKESPGKGDIRC